MSLSQSLRDFIRERLTAAAEEIFTEFDKTIVRYEEELDRQRRLLEICWNPQIKLHRIDLSEMFNKQESHSDLDQGETQRLGLKREDPGPQQMHENHSDLDPLLVKTEQDEPEHPQMQIEPFDLKQEADTFIENPDCDERNLRRTVPNFDQLNIQFSSENENQNQERSDNEDSGSTADAKLRQIKRHREIRKHRDDVDEPKVEEQKERRMKENLRDGDGFHTTHSSERPFSCLTCGKRFKNGENLTSHTKIHSSHKPHLCKTCGKRFAEKNQLMCHISCHTAERPFSCITCGKCFNNSGNLSRHTKIHSGKRPHLCKTCGKTFLRKFQFMSHVQIHTGEKKFSCEICGRRFNNSGNLSRHKKIHSGHKPHLCKTCGKSFFQKSNLTAHIKTHK